MTYMAVEACTASLVVTGVVHADPHEGNVMLADDGRLVFLDFGLMSKASVHHLGPQRVHHLGLRSHQHVRLCTRHM